MSRPNYSAVRLALLHHLHLTEGQRPPLPPSSSSGRQISSLLFRGSALAPVLMILDREARTFANQQRCVKLPLLSNKSLVRRVCRRSSSICQLISRWPVFYGSWLRDSQLSARYSRFVADLITHLHKTNGG